MLKRLYQKFIAWSESESVTDNLIIFFIIVINILLTILFIFQKGELL